MFKGEYIFLDLETTGASAGRDRITEIGLIEVKDGKFIDEWSTLVHPQQIIPINIQAITGITNEMVEDAPTFASLAQTFYDRIKGKTLVAHNVRFDYSFLRNEFKLRSINYAPKMMCTVKLSRLLYPDEKRHGLDSIIKRLDFTVETRHRALADARAIWSFAEHLQKTVEPGILATSIKKLTKERAIPKWLSKETVASIPTSPGVYIFKGHDEAFLYIGKSKHLYTRVMSHFSGDHSNKKDAQINQLITNIDWIECAGEFNALLLEAQLVKKFQPLFNQKLRNKNEQFTIHWDPINGPAIPTVKELGEFEPIPFGSIFGFFQTKKRATKILKELSKEHNLCLKSFGLEKGQGPCFAFQLGGCNGLCVEKESLRDHAMRTSVALSKFAVPTWPFKGEIAITETSSNSGICETNMFNNWTHTGYRRDRGKTPLIYRNTPHQIFDLDTYQIIRRQLSRTSNTIKIIKNF